MEGLKDNVIDFAGAGGIATARTCVDAGGEGVAADISDEEQVKSLIDLALATYGRIDGLFNVAANLSPEEVARDTNVLDIELAAWQRTLAVNLTGYLLTSAAGRPGPGPADDPLVPPRRARRHRRDVRVPPVRPGRVGHRAGDLRRRRRHHAPLTGGRARAQRT